MEVVLKKVKITNSIIKQMYELPFEMFDDNLDILGYVKPSDKYIDKLAIIYHCDKKECYKLNMHWKRRSSYLGYNGNFRGEMFKKVGVDIDVWFEKYAKIVERAENAGHLYI